MADPISEVIYVFRKRVPIEMPLAAIDNVSVTEHPYARRNGKFVGYRVELALADGGAALVLGEYDDLEDAEGLVDWLRVFIRPAYPINNAAASIGLGQKPAIIS